METNRIRIQFDVDCPEENVDELRGFVDHHLDYIIDVENNQDVIKNYYNASSIDLSKDHNNIQKLNAIKELMDEIFANEPNDEELVKNSDMLAVYEELHNLKVCMENAGI